MLRFDLFQDALGWAVAVARDGALIGLSHCPTRERAVEVLERHWPAAEPDPEAAPLPEVRRQLDDYLAGRRRQFDVPLDFAGTPFQRLCWEALLRIPYGETRTYGQLAAALGAPSASRAVGLANGRNPISIVVPCHRVVGASGSLTGYAGGVERKRALLDLERSALV